MKVKSRLKTINERMTIQKEEGKYKRHTISIIPRANEHRSCEIHLIHVE